MIVLLFQLLLNYSLLTGSATSLIPLHPLHVSTLEITQNSGSKTTEVVCKIFTDDFEAALAKQYQVKIDLSAPARHASMKDLVKKYILANLQIKSSARISELNYLGFEKEKEFVYVYLESEMVSPPKTIDVQVSFLHNLYKDQINIIHVTIDGKRKSTKLDFPKKTATFNF
ncbi:DUF6702 family protein [Daejeonella lutea]|uniref:DNA phosphorothioation-dependent restriction protein DptG n=1 Tax=Daejeonella lutea TaxID=572036 RepID=A0A1T5A5H9_9SPHI|nr:DUF6702 family protein [Daejeonella lutea]SKB30165.1 DNA phosphorothioation-dependent restriction protein DptG [Daejeonella lutea]